LLFFLRHIHHGLNLQQSIDTRDGAHDPFSVLFLPRDRQLAHLAVEESVGSSTIDQLARRGYRMEVMPQRSLGPIFAASRGEHRLLQAAATPRLIQAYAITL
jgi:gamma-glutamyltranspeptidase / glutathione hydrolase